MPVYPAKKMSNTDELIIRAVFPTGPYGDLSGEHALELARMLNGAQRHLLDFKCDRSRPQLQATAWFARSRSHARGVASHARPDALQPVAP